MPADNSTPDDQSTADPSNLPGPTHHHDRSLAQETGITSEETENDYRRRNPSRASRDNQKPSNHHHPYLGKEEHRSRTSPSIQNNRDGERREHVSSTRHSKPASTTTSSSPHSDAYRESSPQSPRGQSQEESGHPSSALVEVAEAIPSTTRTAASSTSVGPVTRSLETYVDTPKDRPYGGHPNQIHHVPPGGNPPGRPTYSSVVASPKEMSNQPPRNSLSSPSTVLHASSDAARQIHEGNTQNVSREEGLVLIQGHEDAARLPTEFTVSGRDSRSNTSTGGIRNMLKGFVGIGSGNSTAEELSEENRQLSKENRYLKKKARDRKDILLQLESAYSELEREKQQISSILQSTRHELEHTQRALEDSKALAETRGNELKGAEVFLTKADSVSISDICAKVDGLNEEILQIAASLADYIRFKQYSFPDTSFNNARQTACHYLGIDMVELLCNQQISSASEANPLLVQVVIQMALVSFCYKRLKLWYHPDTTIREFLHQTYSHIRSTESQAVSGRWRAITLHHMRLRDEDGVQHLESILKDIMAISSWYIDGERYALQNRSSSLFKAVEGLRIALGKEFTSADLQVYCIPEKVAFFPGTMEDAWGDSRKPNEDQVRSDTVAGTTGLGLCRHSGARTLENVLSAKVILKSTLLESLEPPPPRSKKGRG